VGCGVAVARGVDAAEDWVASGVFVGAAVASAVGDGLGVAVGAGVGVLPGVGVCVGAGVAGAVVATAVGVSDINTIVALGVTEEAA